MSEQRERLEFASVTPSEHYVNFIETGGGVLFAAESDFRDGHTALKAETYPLAKWLKKNKPSIPIEIEPCDKTFSLNSNEYWIPLAFLANDVGLPLFVSALYDYLKDKTREMLSGESDKVHLHVIRKKGNSYQEITYDGPVEGLKELELRDK